MPMRPFSPPEWAGWWLIETQPQKYYYTEDEDPLNPQGPKVKTQRIRHGEVLRTPSGGPVTFRTAEEAQAHIDALDAGKQPPPRPLEDLPPSSKIKHVDPPAPEAEKPKRAPRKPKA